MKSSVVFALVVAVLVLISSPQQVKALPWWIPDLHLTLPTPTPTPTPTPMIKFMPPALELNPAVFNTPTPTSSPTPTATPTPTGSPTLNPTPTLELTPTPETPVGEATIEAELLTPTPTSGEQKGLILGLSNKETSLLGLIVALVVFIIIQSHWPKIRKWLHEKTGEKDSLPKP